MSDPGTPITNANSTTSVPNHYEICDYTGFKQLPNTLKKTWNKWAVRPKSWESRHPQDLVRSASSDFSKRGPTRPEQNDRFVGSEIDEVVVGDL